MSKGAFRLLLGAIGALALAQSAAAFPLEEDVPLSSPHEGPATENGYCEEPGGPIDFSGPQWNGWSPDHSNARYQKEPGFRAEDVPRLRVKWAFALDGGISSQPTVVGDRVFISTIPGQLYSLDRETGCIHWSYLTLPGDRNWGAGARSTVSVGPLSDRLDPGRAAVYLGDDRSFVHALDAVTGELLWRTNVETHPGSRITGSTVLHEGVLYVPVSSLEEASAGDDNYQCCTFRGSIAALDAYTGSLIWKRYTIEREPEPFRLNRAGVQMFGPSGAPVWSTPTVDAARGLLYVTTGNSYTEISDEAANAVIALDLASGEIRWANQVLSDDNYIAAGCRREVPPANCPEEVGPDFDFGSSAILRDLPSGRSILVVANKGATVFGMDPDDDGRMLWMTQIGGGSALGGVQWGGAADEEIAYIPVSDVNTPPDRRRPGVTAVRLATGEIVWHTPAPPAWCSFGDNVLCSNAHSAAASLIPGIVFSGSLDGHIRAFSAGDGALVWSFDTSRIYETVNGRRGEGGSIDGVGPTIAGGTLFLFSGYDRFAGRKPGNVLLAFTVDGQ
jgi:polyvinyl alcohol dehydrogenase (cytochrome)